MTNKEFNYLMELPKHLSQEAVSLPQDRQIGDSIPVMSDSTKDIFVIDTDRRSTISISKKKIQERYMNVPEQMVRLEVDCRPHRNPDGTALSRNHIHIYTEEYGMSYAYDLDKYDCNLFSNTESFNSLFVDFCKLCKINLENNTIQEVL